MNDSFNSPRSSASANQPGKPIPPALPMEVKLQIASLACVPEQNREDFYDLIEMPVARIWQVDRRAVGTEAGGALVRAANAARALHEAFANLNPDDREWVEKTFAITPYKHWLSPLPRAVTGLATVFNLAVAKAVPCDNPGPFQKGRRKGAVKDLPFQDFVRWLLIVTEECCGGEFKVDRVYEEGTLIDAINIFRPYLPEGVVPTPLPLMTIQRIKSNQSYSAGFGDIDLYDE